MPARVGRTNSTWCSSMTWKMGLSNWVFNQTGQNVWTREPFGLTSPDYSLFGENISNINDSYAAMNTDVTLPSGSSYRLSFKHFFDFEAYYDQNDNLVESYDGAVLEYSTNHGVTWVDARPLFSAGQDYNATIVSTWGNPLGGQGGIFRRQLWHGRIDL